MEGGSLQASHRAGHLLDDSGVFHADGPRRCIAAPQGRVAAYHAQHAMGRPDIQGCSDACAAKQEMI